MWKAAFTGRSETGSVSGRSSSQRKKSRGAESTTSSHSRKEKSRGSTYGDETSTYVTAPSSRTGEPRGLTESAVGMLNNEYEDEDDWEDEDKDARSERKSTRSDGSRKHHHRRRSERDRSRSRSEDRKERKRRESRKESEVSRGKRRDEGHLDEGDDRAIPEMGSFEQFPGQYAGGVMGQSGKQDHMMSGALPSADNQFGPTREDSYGAAAEYYLDEGQSVNFQPGFRKKSPNMLVNPDYHLMAATATEQPAQDTGHGSAADFYGGKTSPVLTAEPQSYAPSKPSSSTKPPKPGRTSSLGTAAAATAAAGVGAAALSGSSQSQYQQTSSTSYQQHTSSSSKPSKPNRQPSGTVTSGSADTYYASPQQYPNSSNPGKQSSHSNAGLYAAGAAAGAAGLAAYGMHEHHQHQHQHQQNGQFTSNSQYGRPPSYNTPQRPNASNGGMDHYHFHEYKGPMTRLKDGILNLVSTEEDVIKMEMYTEYIGVCKYCFDPRTSPNDAPRVHHYHDSSRQDSFEDLRKRKSIERMRRSSREKLNRQGSRVDKDSRYYPERRASGGKAGLVGAGLAAAGLAAGANAMFNDRKDFDDTYSVKTGHRESSAVRRRSRSSSRERRRRSSHGVVGRDSKDEYVTVRTKDGRTERRRVNRSRSRSKDRNTSLAGAAAAGALGASAVAGSSSRYGRGSSPNAAFVRRHSRSRSRSSSPGFFGGFFSPSQKKRRHSPRREHRKKKKQQGGFFNFGNGSFSSSDSDMAFGEGFTSKTNLPLRRKSSTKSVRPVRKKKSDEHIAATVAGIAATAGALEAARRGHKVNKRSSRPELGARKVPQQHSSDDEWEDELPSDVDDASSAGSDIVYGDYKKKPSKRQSMESIGSQSSNGGLSAWGWRWGGKDKRKPSRASAVSPGYVPTPDRNVAGSVGTGLAAGAVTDAGLDAAGRPARSGSFMSSTSSLPQAPMNYVDPKPMSSEAGSLPGSRYASGTFDAPVYSSARPGPAPLQQPQPVTPVKPTFTDHSPEFDTREVTRPPPPRRTQSSPTQSSFGKDAALIGAAALGTAGIIASQRRKSKEPSNVRFGLTEEQERKHESDRRREQEKIDEERRRADRTRALKDEAGRHTREQDVLRAREAENRRAAEAEVERQRIAQREAEEQAEMYRQREREHQEKEEAYKREQDRLRDEERRRRDERERELEAELERKQRQLEDQQRRERDRQREERREYQPKEQEASSDSTMPWGAIAAGAAAAGVGAVAMHEYGSDKERERPSEVEYHESDDRGVAAVQEIKPDDAPSETPLQDDDLFDPDFFKRRRTSSETARYLERSGRAADRVAADTEAYYNEPSQSPAEFFAPKEILDQPSEGKTRVADPIDNNQVLYFNAADDRARSQFQSENESTKSSRKRHAPYGVPQLNLISPTPPPSAPPSASKKAFTSSRSPLSQAETTEPSTESPDDREPSGERKSSRSRSISWGPDQTHVYDVPTPESHHEGRESYIDHRDIPTVAGRVAAAATAAAAVHAALGDSHSGPSSAGHHRHTIDYSDDDARDATAGFQRDAGDVEEIDVDQETPPQYQQPFFESVSDIALGRFGMDSPGTEGAPPVKGFVEEEEVDEPSTQEEKPRHIPGGFDDEYDVPAQDEARSGTRDVSFEKKENESQGDVKSTQATVESKAAKIIEEVQAAPSEPDPEPPLTKKEKRKRDKAAKQAASLEEESAALTAPEPEATRTVPEPAVEADWEPPLSKKDRKKQEKAAKRAATFDDDASASAAKELETAPTVAEPPAEAWAPPLSKKEKKKQEKAAKRAAVFDDETSAPPATYDESTPSVQEAASETTWEPPLSKKEQKKRDKQTKKQGFADVAEAMMTAGGIAAMAASLNDDEDHHALERKSKNVQHVRDVEPATGERDTTAMPGSWDNETEDRSVEPSSEVVDPFQYQVHDESPTTEPQPVEVSTTDKRNSVRFSDAVASSSPRAEASRDLYARDDPVADITTNGYAATDDSTGRTSPEDLRSVASDPTGDRMSSRKSRSSRREDYIYDEPETYEDARSTAASEPADVYESSRKSKRRSRHEDDDTTSVVSSRSRREKAESDSKKEKKGGFFGFFGRKSTDDGGSTRSDGAPLSRQSTKDSKDGEYDDGDRKHHRRRRTKDSDYGDEYEERSESGRRHSHRHRTDEDDDYYSRRESESGRHHHRRRTDEEIYDKDQSFLGERVESMPPLPDNEVSNESATVNQEQDYGIPVSAERDTKSVSREHANAFDLIREHMEKPPSDETQTIREEHMEDFPALPDSRPGSPTALPETDTPQRPTSIQRPPSSTTVPLRFPFGSQPVTPSPRVERAISFGGSMPTSPATPMSTNKARQGRPQSTEIRPLYIVERNRKTPEVEEVLPSLPSSKPSSRASSMIGDDEYESAAEDVGPLEGRRGLFINTSGANAQDVPDDFLDSQQTTPRATEFPQQIFDKPVRQEPQFYTWEDYVREQRMRDAVDEEQKADEQSTSLESRRERDTSTLSPKQPDPATDHVQVEDFGKGIAAAAVLGGAAVLAHKGLDSKGHSPHVVSPTELDEFDSRELKVPSMERETVSVGSHGVEATRAQEEDDQVAEPEPEPWHRPTLVPRDTDDFVSSERQMEEGATGGDIEEPQVEVPTHPPNELDRFLDAEEHLEEGQIDSTGHVDQPTIESKSEYPEEDAEAQSLLETAPSLTRKQSKKAKKKQKAAAKRGLLSEHVETTTAKSQMAEDTFIESLEQTRDLKVEDTTNTVMTDAPTTDVTLLSEAFQHENERHEQAPKADFSVMPSQAAASGETSLSTGDLTAEEALTASAGDKPSAEISTSPQAQDRSNSGAIAEPRSDPMPTDSSIVPGEDTEQFWDAIPSVSRKKSKRDKKKRQREQSNAARESQDEARGLVSAQSIDAPDALEPEPLSELQNSSNVAEPSQPSITVAPEDVALPQAGENENLDDLQPKSQNKELQPDIEPGIESHDKVFFTPEQIHDESLNYASRDGSSILDNDQQTDAQRGVDLSRSMDDTIPLTEVARDIIMPTGGSVEPDAMDIDQNANAPQHSQAQDAQKLDSQIEEDRSTVQALTSDAEMGPTSAESVDVPLSDERAAPPQEVHIAEYEQSNLVEEPEPAMDQFDRKTGSDQLVSEPTVSVEETPMSRTEEEEYVWTSSKKKGKKAKKGKKSTIEAPSVQEESNVVAQTTDTGVSNIFQPEVAADEPTPDESTRAIEMDTQAADPEYLWAFPTKKKKKGKKSQISAPETHPAQEDLTTEQLSRKADDVEGRDKVNMPLGADEVSVGGDVPRASQSAAPEEAFEEGIADSSHASQDVSTAVHAEPSAVDIDQPAEDQEDEALADDNTAESRMVTDSETMLNDDPVAPSNPHIEPATEEIQAPVSANSTVDSKDLPSSSEEMAPASDNVVDSAMVQDAMGTKEPDFSAQDATLTEEPTAAESSMITDEAAQSEDPGSFWTFKPSKKKSKKNKKSKNSPDQSSTPAETTDGATTQFMSYESSSPAIQNETAVEPKQATEADASDFWDVPVKGKKGKKGKKDKRTLDETTARTAIEERQTVGDEQSLIEAPAVPTDKPLLQPENVSSSTSQDLEQTEGVVRDLPAADDPDLQASETLPPLPESPGIEPSSPDVHTSDATSQPIDREGDMMQLEEPEQASQAEESFASTRALSEEPENVPAEGGTDETSIPLVTRESKKDKRKKKKSRQQTFETLADEQLQENVSSGELEGSTAQTDDTHREAEAVAETSAADEMPVQPLGDQKEAEEEWPTFSTKRSKKEKRKAKKQGSTTPTIATDRAMEFVSEGTAAQQSTVGEAPSDAAASTALPPTSMEPKVAARDEMELDYPRQSPATVQDFAAEGVREATPDDIQTPEALSRTEEEETLPESALLEEDAVQTQSTVDANRDGEHVIEDVSMDSVQDQDRRPLDYDEAANYPLPEETSEDWAPETQDQSNEPERPFNADEESSNVAQDVRPDEDVNMAQPGEMQRDIDFTATVAAGLADTGFSPELVVNDPAFQRRATPPDAAGEADPEEVFAVVNKKKKKGKKDTKSVEPDGEINEQSRDANVVVDRAQPADDFNDTLQKTLAGSGFDASLLERTASSSNGVSSNEITGDSTPISFTTSKKKKGKKSKRNQMSFVDDPPHDLQAARSSTREIGDIAMIDSATGGVESIGDIATEDPRVDVGPEGDSAPSARGIEAQPAFELGDVLGGVPTGISAIGEGVAGATQNIRNLAHAMSPELLANLHDFAGDSDAGHFAKSAHVSSTQPKEITEVQPQPRTDSTEGTPIETSPVDISDSKASSKLTRMADAVDSELLANLHGFGGDSDTVHFGKKAHVNSAPLGETSGQAPSRSLDAIQRDPTEVSPLQETSPRTKRNVRRLSHVIDPEILGSLHNFVGDADASHFSSKAHASSASAANTSDRGRSVHDESVPAAGLVVGGEREMDIDEMDRAYRAFKKNKRKQKKQKASASQSGTASEAEAPDRVARATDLTPQVEAQTDRPNLEFRGAMAAAGTGVGVGAMATQVRRDEDDRSKSSPQNVNEQDLSRSERPTDASTPANWSFANLEDEGQPLPESPLLGNKQQDIARDSGYQEMNWASSQRQSAESTSRDFPNIRPVESRESLHSRRSAEPLRISTDTGSDWEMNVPKTRGIDNDRESDTLHIRNISRDTDDTPLQSTTKNRASYLFQSTPENLRDAPAALDLPTPSAKSEASDYFRTRSRDSNFEEQQTPRQPDYPIERSISSPPPSGTMSPRVPLGTIPEELHGQKRTIADTDSRELDNTKVIRRTETPHAIRARERELSPTPLPFAQGIEGDRGIGSLDQTMKRTASRQLPMENRSPSIMSNRSNASASQIRSPDELRSFSRASNRSGTPTLRRIDRSLSGDLRAASRRGETGSAVGARASPKTIPFEAPPTPPSNDDELMDAGASRSANMSDVYQGYGDAQASQTSPTRPPSMRKRQSMHIMDLESRLDQLTAENQALQEAKQGSYLPEGSEDQSLHSVLEARDLQIREKDNEINQIRAMLHPMQEEIDRLTEINNGLTEANHNLVDDTNGRYATLQQEHAHANEQWQNATRELDTMRQEHGRLTSGMRDVVETEIATALASKNSEVRQLREELDVANEKIRSLQVQIQSTKGRDFLTVRDEDYFDGACQKLCQHVQQWVLRFSKLSDNRISHLSTDLKDDKIEARLDNAILDGSDVDKLLVDRIRRRDVFMSVVMTMVWEYVFTRYLFGMDREQRQKLKSLEKTLAEVGPPRAVAQWRATTLTLLSKRPAFAEQRDQDNEAVANEIFGLLCNLLPPPSSAKEQLLTSLQKVIGIAVDLSIEMRCQRAEYIMLPPLQPEYDTNGDLVRKVHFNSSLMNERSGMFSSNQELEETHAVVKIVLFPLVVKKGDEVGEGEEEIVVCPAQVLVHNENARGKKIVRVQSGAMEIDDPRRSAQSLVSNGNGSMTY